MKLSNLFIIALLLSTNLTLGAIYSSVQSGDWTDNNTWGTGVGIFPQSGDEVVINHQVAVNGTYSCLTATVNPTGILRGGDGTTRYLTVTNWITNAGSIFNSPGGWDFRITVGGNITNTGSWWHDRLTFNGSVDQNISGSGEYRWVEVISQKPSGKLILTTDANFQQCTMDLNADTIQLNGTSTLLFEGGVNSFIRETTIRANNNEITLRDGAYITEADILNAKIHGQVECAYNVDFFGNVWVEDTLRGRNGTTYTADVLGNLTNNGAILNSPGASNFHLYVSGNVSNNGVIDCQELRLNGTTNQNVSASPTATFTMDRFEATNNLNTIFFNSDTRFLSCELDFNSGMLTVGSGYEIWMSGPRQMQRVTVTGNNSHLRMDSDAYLNTVTYSDVTFWGVVEVVSNVILTGDIINNSFLRARNGTTYTLDVNGNFTNNGSVTNSSGGFLLNFDISGHLTNNNLFTNNEITLDGNSRQNISMADTGIFMNAFLYSTNTVDSIHVLTDIEFLDCNIYCYGNWMVFNPGIEFKLTQAAHYLGGTKIKGNGSTLFIDNDAFFYDCQIWDITFDGTVETGQLSTLYGEIVNNGTFRAKNGSTRVIDIIGNLTNNGIIDDSPSAFILNVSITGNLINNSVWSCNILSMDGNTDQNISMAPGGIFDGHELNSVNATGTTRFLTDINFQDCQLDFNNYPVWFNPGIAVTHRNGGKYIRDATITGNGATFFQSGDCYIENVIASDLSFQGQVEVANNVLFTGNITVEDTLQARGGSTRFLTIDGNLEVQGLVRDDPGAGHSLVLDISGNIHNDGLFTNNRLQFEGLADQTVGGTSSAIFNVPNINNLDTNGKVILTSDVHFNGSTVDFNDATIQMSQGNTLFHNANADFAEVTILGNGATFNQSGGGRINHFEGYHLQLAGEVRVRGTTNFYNSLWNTGILRGNDGTTYFATVHGDLVNDGQILDSPSAFAFYLSVSGDITNNGVFDNSQLVFTGTTDQNLWLNSPVGVSNISSNSNGIQILAHTDMSFINSNVGIWGDTLHAMTESIINIDGGFWSNLFMWGNSSTINMSNNAYLQNTYMDEINFEGEVRISGYCGFFGSCTNEGILRGNDGTTYTANFSGDFYNHGSVLNSPSGFNFQTNLLGDVWNYGSWTNYRNHVDGNSDQNIYLINGSAISSPVRMDGNISGSGGQWYKDHNGILGEGGNELVLTPLASADTGQYYRTTTSDTSRNIFVSYLDPCSYDPPVINGTVTDETVSGAGDGSIDLEVENHAPPYSFNWSTGDNTEDLSGLVAGTYTITVSDSLGCQVVENYTVGSPCEAPASVWSERITPTTARLAWSSASSADHYQIRGRVAGNNFWVYLPISAGQPDFKNIFGLSNNTTYIWQIRSWCDVAETDSSNWSMVDSFTTGCYPPDSIWTDPITGNGAQLNWTKGWGAEGYEIKGRKVGNPGFVTIGVGGGNTLFKQVFGLLSGTSYEWTVRNVCSQASNVKSGFPPLTQFTTSSVGRYGNSQKRDFSFETPHVYIYPNPANEVLNIQLENVEAKKVIIRDLMGRELTRFEVSESSKTLVLKLSEVNLSPGSYLVEIQGSEGVLHLKKIQVLE